MPPLAVTVAEPVAVPQADCPVAVAVATIAIGCVGRNVAVAIQLFASVTLTV